MIQLLHIRKLIAFALRSNPLLAFNLLLAVLSAGLEILAMSCLFPISTLAAGGHLEQNSFPVRLLRAVDFEPTVWTLIVAFTLLFLLRVLTQIASQGIALYLSQDLKARLASQAFANTVSLLSLKEIEQKGMAYFITLAGDEAARSAALVLSFVQFVSSGALAALYFVAIAHYSPAIAGAVLAFLLITFCSLYGTFKKTHRLSIQQITEANAAASVFLDSLNNLRSVRAFTAEKYVIDSYRARMHRYVRTSFMVEFLNVLGRLGPILILLLSFQAWLVGASNLETGDFAFIVTIAIFLLRFFPVVGQSFNVVQRFVSEAKVSRDISEIIDLRHPDQGRRLPKLADPVRKLEIRNLRFSHDKKTTILNGINIRFESGHSYALAGPSGTGKSTLVDLILDFYGPDRGSIYLNDVPTTSIDRSSLRQRVLVIGQHTTIFNHTVWDNIAFGTTPSEAAMQRACELACIKDVIDSLPDGFKTVLNYQGSNLSGGERQRVGIARALVRMPDVLILDESTNALDKSTQEQVIRNILEEYKTRIVIFVTHDPAITQVVDEVITLDSFNASSHSEPQIPSSSDLRIS